MNTYTLNMIRFDERRGEYVVFLDVKDFEGHYVRTHLYKEPENIVKSLNTLFDNAVDNAEKYLELIRQEDK